MNHRLKNKQEKVDKQIEEIGNSNNNIKFDD